MGAVVDRVRLLIPSSYRAMLSGVSPYFGQSDFQAHADLVKWRLFATTVAATAEASTWDLNVIAFMGKLTTLQVIPAAVDYWGSIAQTSSFNTGTQTGTTSFVNRPEELWKVFDRLQMEAKQEFTDLRVKYGFIFLRRIDNLVPAVGYGSGANVTPDPQTAMPPYAYPSTFLPATFFGPPVIR